MSASRHYLLFAALGCLLSPASTAWAQAYGMASVVEHNDLNWFEPADLDLDGRIDSSAGYFFRMEKLGWAYTPERVEIGDPDVVNFSEQIYRPNAPGFTQVLVNSFAIDGFTPAEIASFFGVTYQVDGGGNIITAPVVVTVDGVDTTFDVPQIVPGSGNGPPNPYIVQNSIKDAIPEADFAWGERYEIGYSDGERGWMIGILDGPDQELNKTYGLGRGSEYTSQSTTDFANQNPFVGAGPPVDADGDGILDTPLGTNALFALGFGSVAVNFQAEEGFFSGFRDYLNNAFPVGTQTGPIYTIVSVGGVADAPLVIDGGGDGGGVVDGGTAPFLPDDINGNTGTVFLILSDDDGDGVGDTVVGTVVDYGDLHDFDVFFSDVSVRSVTELDGIELMLTHELSTRHHLEQGRRDSLQLAYGVRFLQMSDLFSWQGSDSFLGQTSASVDIENQIIGPQVALRWTRDRGPWDFSVAGRFMFGYNVIDRNLDGAIGAGLVPGAVNSSVIGRPTVTVLGEREDDFSPLGELRVEARYKFSKALALKVGYNATFIDNIQRSSNSLVYSLPTLGLKDGKSDIFVSGINMGVEVRY